jgi:hypothetical protein
MIRQEVLVELYPGLALISDEMILENRGEKPLKLRMGMPESSRFAHDMVSVVEMGTVQDLAVLWRGGQLSVKRIGSRELNGDLLPSLPESYRSQADSWLIWELDLPAKKADTLKISYAVKTGPAELSRGGNVRRAFFFGFLLEQARAWNGPIGETVMAVRLKGGLSFGDIFGLYPRAFIRDDEETMYLAIEGRNPISHDNVLIGYGSKVGFDHFVDYLQDRQKYLTDKIGYIKPESKALRPMPPGNFDVSPVREYAVLGVLAACLGLVALLLAYLIKRR